MYIANMYMYVNFCVVLYSQLSRNGSHLQKFINLVKI